MASYEIRNNMKSRVLLGTFGGVASIRPKGVRILNVFGINAPRLRALHQSGALSIAPGVNRSGRTSRRLPGLHFGLGKRAAALPAQPVKPTLQVNNVVPTPGTKSLSIAYGTVAGGDTVVYRVSAANGTTFGRWRPAPASPIVLSGLTTGAAYSVQVARQNEAGTGPSTTVTGTPT